MNDLGLQGVLVYMLVYAFANLGIWALILTLRKHEYGGEKIDDGHPVARRKTRCCSTSRARPTA